MVWIGLIVVINDVSAGERDALCVATCIAYCGNLARALYVAAAGCWLEGDGGIAVVAVGVETYVVACPCFRFALAEAKKSLCGDGCRSVGVEGSAHATANLTFHNNDAARYGELSVAVYAVGIAGACLDVMYAACHKQVSAGISTTKAPSEVSAGSAPVIVSGLGAVSRTVFSTGSVPSVIGSIYISNAALGLDVPCFQTFVGVLHVNGSVINVKG